VSDSAFSAGTHPGALHQTLVAQHMRLLTRKGWQR
jgi:hypothetical protein